MNQMSQMNLDPTTFLFCMSLFGFMMSAITYSTDSTLGKNIAGLSDWAKAMLITGMAFLLFYTRGRAPDFVSVYVANTLILAIGIFGVLAHTKFFNMRTPKHIVAALTTFGVLGAVYNYFYSPDMIAMVLAISLPMSLNLMLLIYIITRNTQWRTQKSTWTSLVSMALMSIALLVRCWKVLFADGSSAALYAKSGTQFGFLVTGALCIMGSSMGFLLMVHEKHRKDILESSKRDGLTGLYHRSAFLEYADQIEAKGDTQYSLLMVDIDYFKSVNDTYGHTAGDMAITHVARLIANSIRNTDLAGRYGGEEFCILLRGCGKEETEKFAQRLVLEASKQRIRIPEGREISITISAGYAWRPEARRKDDPEPSPKALLDAADQALLVAKRSGRNRAVSA